MCAHSRAGPAPCGPQSCRHRRPVSPPSAEVQAELGATRLVLEAESREARALVGAEPAPEPQQLASRGLPGHRHLTPGTRQGFPRASPHHSWSPRARRWGCVLLPPRPRVGEAPSPTGEGAVGRRAPGGQTEGPQGTRSGPAWAPRGLPGAGVAHTMETSGRAQSHGPEPQVPRGPAAPAARHLPAEEPEPQLQNLRHVTVASQGHVLLGGQQKQAMGRGLSQLPRIRDRLAWLWRGLRALHGNPGRRLLTLSGGLRLRVSG